MKGTTLLFTLVVLALVFAAVPLTSHNAYAADSDYKIERLVPADTAEIETGGGEIGLVPMKFERLTGIEGLYAADTIEVETGAHWVPAKFEGDVSGRVDLISPAK